MFQDFFEKVEESSLLNINTSMRLIVEEFTLVFSQTHEVISPFWAVVPSGMYFDTVTDFHNSRLSVTKRKTSICTWWKQSTVPS